MIHHLKLYFVKHSERFFVLLGQFTAVALIFGCVYFVITAVAQVDGYSFDPWLTFIVVFLWFSLYIKASSIETILKQIAQNTNGLLPHTNTNIEPPSILNPIVTTINESAKNKESTVQISHLKPKKKSIPIAKPASKTRSKQLSKKITK